MKKGIIFEIHKSMREERDSGVTNKKKRYLVIGNPIKHSLSPKLHNYWFKNNDINAVYDKKKINKSDIKSIISKIRNEKISGINVTVPFKKSVIPFLDKLTPDADEVQSVNTIYKENNIIIGANTDILAFEKSINSYKINNKKILILGAGGVVPSIIHVLRRKGPARITISNRTKKKAEDLKKMYKKLEIIDWGKTTDFDVIINATSLGLNDKDKFELDLGNTISRKRSDSTKLFYDVIYKQWNTNKKPNLTNFLKKGKDLGHHIMDGGLMFVYQAQEAFTIWHGHGPGTRDSYDTGDDLDFLKMCPYD